MLSYRLKSPIVAAEQCREGMHIIHIAQGMMLYVPETDRDTGMIEIVYEGRNISVYLQDLRERAELVDGADA